MDVLIGGSGNDQMWGGDQGAPDGASDTFVMDDGHRADVIADFEVGIDLIDLSGNAAFSTFSDVTASAYDKMRGVWIFGNGRDKFVLEGLSVDDLDSGDFIF